MRDYRIFAPADCIVSNTAAENDHALRQIETVLKANVAVSERLIFRSGHQSRPAKQSADSEKKLASGRSHRGAGNSARKK